MTIHHRRELKAEAARILAQTPNQKRIVLLYAGVAAALSVLTALVSYLLDAGIAETGGLSGFRLRSILDTAQQLLSYTTSIALPFWGLGYTHAMLKISRQQPVRDTTLLEGFRRFGPGLRLMLLQYLIVAGLFTLCIYGVILILGMTPIAAPAYEVLEPMMDQMMTNPEWMPDTATALALFDALLPILIAGTILGCLVVIPLSYRMRFAQLRIMDDPRCGARQAISTSLTATRRNCLALLKLDLSFWWYWLLTGLILALTFCDLILAYLGVNLPLDPAVASWAFSLAATALQVALYVTCQNQVSVTYALAYDSLLPQNP